MTLIGTSVLIDAFDIDAPLNQWVTDQIAKAKENGDVCVNPSALAECSVRLDIEQVQSRLLAQGVGLEALPISASGPTARAFAVYLKRRKADARVPKTPLPDFFIGAHTEAEKWAVLTNDATRFRTYFPRVNVIAPED